MRVARAFRNNRSLKRVEILPDSDPRAIALLVDSLRLNWTVLSVAQRHRVQTYCTRNKRISDLLVGINKSDAEESSLGTQLTLEKRETRRWNREPSLDPNHTINLWTDSRLARNGVFENDPADVGLG
jgi:hypothetical protein